LLETSLGARGHVGLDGPRRVDGARAGAWDQGTADGCGQARRELTEWLTENSFPLVLKTDESFGGRGVRIVHSAVEADRAWRALRSPPSPARAIKRAIVNRDMNYAVPSLLRFRPVVNAQAFVWGQDVNCTVACWQGTVLASITVPVLETVGV
jgi:hypothetical protein